MLNIRRRFFLFINECWCKNSKNKSENDYEKHQNAKISDTRDNYFVEAYIFELHLQSAKQKASNYAADNKQQHSI
jgi:hypothetical protein